jgi:alkanesulfonate monooxygenase SsuD/methylene tetrahydromethanopterin reductase-like flavin-dependent oxidoreductase (luciferase family)
MKFGIFLDTHVDKWKVVKYAEDLGFDRAWIGDSPMLWSDCYATLALAAANTTRIRIGTGMTAPALRPAPVTACAIGSINQLAPGRVFLGLGTGFTSALLLGQKPSPLRAMRKYQALLRGLLDGDAVEYEHSDRCASIQFMNRDRHYVNLDSRIPIYIAANGPLAMALAGEVGDGWMYAGRAADELRNGMAAVREGASRVDRTLPADFLTACSTAGCVLRRGERLTDDRIIDQVGSIVTVNLHLAYELWRLSGNNDAVVPDYFSDVWEAYLGHVAQFRLPERDRFREVHEGHATYVQKEERQFVRPAGIRASCLVGEPDDIIAQIRELEAAGITEVSLAPSADAQCEVFADFAKYILPNFSS